LNFTRDLIALRRRLSDLHAGAYTELPAPPDVWAWQRGQDAVVAVNLGREPVEVRDIEEVVVLGTSRDRETEVLHDRCLLAPAEGIVALRQGPSDNL
jgi:glycosidase